MIKKYPITFALLLIIAIALITDRIRKMQQSIDGLYAAPGVALYIPDGADPETGLQGYLDVESVRYAIKLSSKGWQDAEGVLIDPADNSEIPFTFEDLYLMSEGRNAGYGAELSPLKPRFDGFWHNQYQDELFIDSHDGKDIQAIFRKDNQKTVLAITHHGFDIYAIGKINGQIKTYQGKWISDNRFSLEMNGLQQNWTRADVNIKPRFKIQAGVYTNGKTTLNLSNYDNGYYSGTLSSTELNFGNTEHIYRSRAEVKAHSIEQEEAYKRCELKHQLEEDKKAKKRENDAVYTRKNNGYDPFAGLFFDVTTISPCYRQYASGASMSNLQSIVGYNSEEEFEAVLMAGHRVFKIYSDSRDKVYLLDGKQKYTLNRVVQSFVAGIYSGVNQFGEFKSVILRDRIGDTWHGTMINTDEGLEYPLVARINGNALYGEFIIPETAETVYATLQGTLDNIEFITRRNNPKHYPIAITTVFDKQPLRGDEWVVAGKSLFESGHINIEQFKGWISTAQKQGSELAKNIDILDIKDTQKPVEVRQPKLIKVPAGSVTMGCAKSDDDCYVNQKGEVKISSVPSFYMMQTEVTVGAFKKFVADTGYKPSSETRGGCADYHQQGKLQDKWRMKPDMDWQFTSANKPRKANEPVVCISYVDAEQYAKWLSYKTGTTYRLPTEVEWEHAAKANRNWGVSLYKNTRSLCGYTNGADKSSPFDDKENKDCNDGYAAGPAPVKTYKPNPLGLYDMIGNVWEWTQDCFHADPSIRPNSAKAWLEENDGQCQHRVIKGSSWANGYKAQKPAARAYQSMVGSNYTGFRLVKE